MRIVYFVPYYKPKISGVGMVVENLAKELIKQGYQIHIFTSLYDKKLPKEEIIEGIHVHRFKIKFKFGNYMVWDYEKKLKDIMPDIIHCHSYRHQFNKVVDYAVKNKIKCYLTPHAPFNRDRKFIGETFVRLYDFLKGRKLLKKFNRVFAISRWEIPYLKKLGCKNIEYLPNGVDELFVNTEHNNVKKNKILYFGRICEEKGAKLLMEAFNSLDHPYWKLVMAGPLDKDFVYMDLLQNTDNLTCLDPIYGIEEKIKLINDCDIYVNASKTEGMPLAVVEAMSLGKLVIVSDNDGNLELIEHGKNGLVFKEGDLYSLLNTLRAVIYNPNEFKGLGDNARKTVKVLTWKNIARRLQQIYQA